MGLPYGAGNQPAGWTPPSAYYPVPQQAPYVVYQDPSSGQADTGRLIDQATRQFVYTSAGNTQGMSSVQQCVLIAWGTLTIGVTAAGTFNGGWQNQVQSLFVNSVRYLVSNKLMSITQFQVARFGTNGVKVTIKWRDLTTDQEYPFTVVSN